MKTVADVRAFLLRAVKDADQHHGAEARSEHDILLVRAIEALPDRTLLVQLDPRARETIEMLLADVEPS